MLVALGKAICLPVLLYTAVLVRSCRLVCRCTLEFYPI